MLKRTAFGFLIVAPITLVVAALVSLVYSLFAHGAAAIDWGSAIRLAIILGIVIPLVQEMQGEKPTP
jgi:uncharacterized membrane protein YraQ (UPF0718 family)